MTPARLDPPFEAVIVPHRSLSPRGLAILSFAIAGMVGAAAVVFLAMGAWPVVGFCGLEIGLALVLLRLNAAAQRTSEVVLIADGAARITRTDRHGRRRETTLPLAWLRVEMEDRPGRVPALRLRNRTRVEEIATALGEAEKRSLADALQDAVARAQAPRFANPQL